MANPLLRAKRLIVGRPLATERLETEPRTQTTPLAVLSSDAISSVAYATDEVLYVLAPLGAAALSYVFPISAVIVGLLVLVALSYRQTIFAYPGGGGSFTVAYEKLGVLPALSAVAIVVLMFVNLRGVRESGAAFSLPTYVFIAAMLALIGTGLAQLYLGGTHISVIPTHPANVPTPASVGGVSP